MKHKISLLCLFLAVVFCLSACQGAPTAGENSSAPAAQKAEVPAVSEDLSYFCHRQLRDDLTLYLYMNEEGIIADGRIQNLTTGETCAVPVKDFYFSGSFLEIRVAEKFFYLFSSACAAFSFDGKLLKAVDMPEDMPPSIFPAFCLSDDLTKIAYVKANADGAQQLVVQTLDTGEEKTVTTLDAAKALQLSDVTSLSFSKDGNVLGFSGITNPDPAEQSVECYGRIFADGSNLELVPAPKTAVRFFGDSMFVQDSGYSVNETRSGKIMIYNFANDLKTEVQTQNPLESDFAFPVNETDFVTLLPTADGAALTVYQNGKATIQKEIAFASESDKNNSTGNLAFASYSPVSGKILLDGYKQNGDRLLPYLYELDA